MKNNKYNGRSNSRPTLSAQQEFTVRRARKAMLSRFIDSVVGTLIAGSMLIMFMCAIALSVDLINQYIG